MNTTRGNRGSPVSGLLNIVPLTLRRTCGGSPRISSAAGFPPACRPSTQPQFGQYGLPLLAAKRIAWNTPNAAASLMRMIAARLRPRAAGFKGNVETRGQSLCWGLAFGSRDGNPAPTRLFSLGGSRSRGQSRCCDLGAGRRANGDRFRLFRSCRPAGRSSSFHARGSGPFVYHRPASGSALGRGSHAVCIYLSSDAAKDYPR